MNIQLAIDILKIGFYSQSDIYNFSAISLLLSCFSKHCYLRSRGVSSDSAGGLLIPAPPFAWRRQSKGFQTRLSVRVALLLEANRDGADRDKERGEIAHRVSLCPEPGPGTSSPPPGSCFILAIARRRSWYSPGRKEPSLRPFPVSIGRYHKNTTFFFSSSR